MDSKFNCSQDSLIRTCILIWGYCKTSITRMSGYKSKYTTVLCDAEIAAANAILLMPNNNARQQAHEITRIGMVNTARVLRNLWQDMKGYVRDAYPGEEFDTMLTSAGWSDYAAASNNKWTAVQGLAWAALNFMDANGPVLRDRGYMPDDFADRFRETATMFDTLYNDFVSAEQAAQEATEARIAACNSIYEKVNGCCSDGQNVFRNDGVVKDEFVFSAVLAMVDPSGPAGLKGYATYIINGEPVVGLTAEIESINKRAVVNAEGFYDFGPLSGGTTYTVKYMLGEEVKDTEVLIIPVGTTVHKNVEID